MNSFLVVFSCFLVIASAGLDPAFVAEVREKMIAKVQACATEVGAGPDDVATLVSKTMPASHEGKCLMKCMQKKMNILNDDGTINKEGAIASLDILKDKDADLHAKMVSIFQNCGKTVEFDSDPCVYASNLGHCVAVSTKEQNIGEDF